MCKLLLDPFQNPMVPGDPKSMKTSLMTRKISSSSGFMHRQKANESIRWIRRITIFGENERWRKRRIRRIRMFLSSEYVMIHDKCEWWDAKSDGGTHALVISDPASQISHDPFGYFTSRLVIKNYLIEQFNMELCRGAWECLIKLIILIERFRTRSPWNATHESVTNKTTCNCSVHKVFPRSKSSGSGR